MASSAMAAFALAACTTFVCVGGAKAQISDDVVKIGVLTDMNSLYSLSLIHI